MKVRALLMVVACVGLGWTLDARIQEPEVIIVEPTADTLVTGPTAVVARISPPGTAVQSMTFTVDGRVTCTVEAPPWQCTFDGGPAVAQRHVRVVARLTNGGRAVANVRTRPLAFAESVRVTAVQVPVIVRDWRGRFVRGLTVTDFLVKEDGVPQTLAGVSSENVPLDVVLALDISASMTDAMDDVLEASRRFVSRLRDHDTATVLAFNDNTFVVVDRETDAARRQQALTGLTAWGGTALHDATAEALALVARGSGRKGVVIFSDGEDRTSRTHSAATVRRIQESDALVYTIAFGSGATDAAMRRQLELNADASGGRVFFSKTVAELDEAFTAIIEELSSQYVLSYEPAQRSKSGWRRLEVDVARRGARVRARDGYLAP